jgi:hypothetical protein
MDGSKGFHSGLHHRAWYVTGLKPEFDKRNCKIIGLSVDSVRDHKPWSKDIEEIQGHAVSYPLFVVAWHIPLDFSKITLATADNPRKEGEDRLFRSNTPLPVQFLF